MLIQKIIKKNKSNSKEFNFSNEDFAKFLNRYSIEREIYENDGIFDIIKRDSGENVDSQYMNYFINKISNLDHLSLIFDHPCLFEDSKGGRIFVYHPYTSISQLENNNYIQNKSLSEWCLERGLHYESFEESWYNPNRTIMIVIKVADKKVLKKFILNSFENELYGKEQIFDNRLFSKKNITYLEEERESFYSWYLRTVLLVNSDTSLYISTELLPHFTNFNALILSNIGFPKNERNYQKISNYLSFLPPYSMNDDYILSFHYLYGLYKSSKYYELIDFYEREFNQPFKDRLSKNQINLLEDIVEGTRFL